MENANAAVEQTAKYLCEHDLVVMTAESCTAGLIAARLGDVEGCGDCLAGGITAYSVPLKLSLLGVRQATIDRYGLTSEEVAREMAIGALTHGRANTAVSATGVAGPKAGDDGTPAGTMWLAWAFRDAWGTRVYAQRRVFTRDRNANREDAALFVIERLPFFHQIQLRPSQA